MAKNSTYAHLVRQHRGIYMAKTLRRGGTIQLRRCRGDGDNRHRGSCLVLRGFVLAEITGFVVEVLLNTVAAEQFPRSCFCAKQLRQLR